MCGMDKGWSDTFFYMDTFFSPINFHINGVSVLKGLTLGNNEGLSAGKTKTVRNNEVSA